MTIGIISCRTQIFKIDYLTANTNAELLCNQAKKYNPHTICIGDDSKYNFGFSNKAEISSIGYGSCEKLK